MFKLTEWQKTQAAMLYYFSSLGYLKELHAKVTALINKDVEPALDVAIKQNRDQILKNRRWGIRDTAKNWENHAWQILKDLQASLARDIALRSAGVYTFTAVNDRLRALDEYSVAWMTSDEESKFEKSIAEISNHNLPISYTMDEPDNCWNDGLFALCYQDYFSDKDEIPKFNVRLDVTASTGDITPKTGVYVALDDPHAALQFAWTQKGKMRLRLGNTFNQIGFAALHSVGRTALWFDKERMFNFADMQIYEDKFRDWIYVSGEPAPDAAPGAVAMAAFESRPCHWAFVEIVPGQMELVNVLPKKSPAIYSKVETVAGGTPCKTGGFYFTPSVENSRRLFHAGEITPDLTSDYGKAYWQWDDDQSCSK